MRAQPGQRWAADQNAGGSSQMEKAKEPAEGDAAERRGESVEGLMGC